MSQLLERYQHSPDGFDGDPEQRVVEAGKPLYVYRAHGSSKLIGRFFFTPHIAGTPRMNWTADMLEMELNAALWDNDFRYLAKFRVKDGTRYAIGPIAQDYYIGRDQTPWGRGRLFLQRAYFVNKNLFHQVCLLDFDPKKDDWHNFLELVEDVPIKAGRFHRANGKGNC